MLLHRQSTPTSTLMSLQTIWRGLLTGSMDLRLLHFLSFSYLTFLILFAQQKYGKYILPKIGSSKIWCYLSEFAYATFCDHPCRFAQFFTGPLFTPSATGREVNAVNSENDKNLQNDSWRMHQLDRATCNQKHPYSKFGTGKRFKYCLYKFTLWISKIVILYIDTVYKPPALAVP